jgi:hypothetical protein
LVGLTDEFKNLLKDAYNTDVHWKKVQQLLRIEEADQSAAEDYGTRIDRQIRKVSQWGRPWTGIDFVEKDGLIYHIDHTHNIERLAISKYMVGTGGIAMNSVAILKLFYNCLAPANNT